MKGKGEEGGTYINIKLPMPPPTDIQRALQPPLSHKRLVQHRAQEHHYGLVVTLAGDVHCDFDPFCLALPSKSLLSKPIPISLPLLRQTFPPPFPNNTTRSPLDLSLHANDGFAAVSVAETCAAVAGGEEICFGG